MPETASRIISVSLIATAVAFYLAGFFLFKTSRISAHNCQSTYGKLVGFRKYYTTDQWGDNTQDYAENKVGRVPIFEIELDGERVPIASAIADYSLTKEDIGRQIKVRYKSFVGIKLIPEDKKSIENYEQLQNTLFWGFMSVATIVLILGALAHIVL